MKQDVLQVFRSTHESGKRLCCASGIWDGLSDALDLDLHAPALRYRLRVRMQVRVGDRYGQISTADVGA